VWSSLFPYGGLDYLWWTLIAFLVARLLHTENPRYWLGMMTKYTGVPAVHPLCPQPGARTQRDWRRLNRVQDEDYLFTRRVHFPLG
jgi:hypothetical protein